MVDDMIYGYQDDDFVVEEVAGKSLRSLTLFLDKGVPQKLLGQLENGHPFHCYLSAFIGFWSALSESEYQQVRDDYAHCEAIDLAAQHGLIGAQIQRAVCRRAGGRVQIDVAFERGTLSMSEVNPSDPHTDSDVTFTAA